MIDIPLLYKSLDTILQRNKIGCTLVNEYLAPVRAPRCYRVGVRLNDANDVIRIGKLSEILATAANVKNVLVSREKNILWLDYQMEKDEWTLIRASDIDGIGVAMDGTVIDFEPTNSSPHTMVAGSTGSGKSSLLRCIMWRIIKKKMGELYIVDPHGDFEQFDDCAIVSNESEPIHQVYEIHESRRKNKKTTNLGIVFLVADEIQSSSVVGEAGAFNKENLTMLTSLAKEGRKFGIRLILGTQKPLKRDFPFLDQMGYRFTGKLRDSGASMFVTGVPTNEFDASKLTGDGDFGVVKDGDIIRFQAGLFERGEKLW